MRRYDRDVGPALGDDGLRRITRLTWRTGAIAGGASGLAAIAFGHGVRHPPQASRPGGGATVIPVQPPAPAAGSGQVTSGASS